MNQKTLNTLMNAAIAGLCVAGLLFILLSIFADMNTMTWGLLCMALFNLMRILWHKKAT